MSSLRAHLEGPDHELVREGAEAADAASLPSLVRNRAPAPASAAVLGVRIGELEDRFAISLHGACAAPAQATRKRKKKAVVALRLLKPWLDQASGF